MVPLIWQGDGNNPSPNFNQRANFYNASGWPTVQWNGTHDIWSPTVATYTGAYNQFVNLPSPMTLELEVDISGSTLTANATVNLLENVTTQNNRIVFVITRNLDGIQSPNYFASVARYHEQNFTLSSAGDTQVYTQDMALESNWNIETLRVIAIVQTFSGNNQIHQAAMFNLDDSDPPDPILGAPQNLTGNFNKDSVNVVLVWSAPTYQYTTHEGYRVYRNGEPIQDLNANAGYYMDSTIELDNVYTYYLTALYSDGESEPSNVYEVNTGDDPPEIILGVPKNLVGEYQWGDSIGGGRIVLNWDVPEYENTTLIGYNIFMDKSLIEENYIGTEIDWVQSELEIEYDVTYSFYVIAVYTDGESLPSNMVELTPVSETDITLPPVTTRLGNNFPNPFNPSTTIYFELHNASEVKLEIFNLRGQLVKTLVEASLDIGRHTAVWNGQDENGAGVSSGVYFYRLQAEEFENLRKMVLLK